AHGGKWRRPAHRPDHSRSCRHLYNADLYTCCARSSQDRLYQLSSPGQKEMKKPINASREIQRGMDAFIKYLKHERNASKHTVRAYENELKAFASFLGPEIRWKDIDHVLV